MAQAQAVAAFSISAGSTSAVPIDLTGLWSDGGSHTPHLYTVWYRNGTGGSNSTGNCFWGFGMSDGTSHYAGSCAIEDNVAASNSASYHTDNGPICECDLTGALTGLVNHTSFAADTVTITPSDALTNALHGFIVAHYDTVGAKVMVDTLPTSTGSFSKTGAGFAPQSAQFISRQANAATLDSGGTGAVMSIGIATGSSAQCGLYSRIRDAQTDDYTLAMISTGFGVIAFLDTTSGLDPAAHTTFTQFDADGYTCNQVAGTVARSYAVALLGSPATVVTTAHQTSVTTWAVSTPGISPTGVLALSYPAQTASQSLATESMHHAIGAATTASMASVEVHSNDRAILGGGQVTEEYSRSTSNKLLTHYDRTGVDTFAVIGEIEESAWASGQVTLSQTDANTAAVFIALLVFGDAAAGSTIPVLMNIYRQQRAG